MTKRGNGEGSFRKRSNGTWEGRVSYVEHQTGQRKSLSVYGATRKEAVAKIAEAKDRLERGVAVVDTAVTLAQWITTWTAVNLPASKLRESTQLSYESVVRCRILPTPLADLPLRRIRPTSIDEWVLQMRKEGVAPSTQRRAYSVLSKIFDAAVRDTLIAKNPIKSVDKPNVGRPEQAVLLPSEVHALLTCAAQKNHWLFPVLQLVAVTGLRRGEVLALRWGDVNFETGRIGVRVSLGVTRSGSQITDVKTKASKRSLMLPPEVVHMLEELRHVRQRDVARRGELWRDDFLVFARPDGRPLSPDTLARHFKKLAVQAGIDRVTTQRFGLHSIRHQGVTAMLDAGLSPKVVADWFGHSSPRITLEVYAHTSEATASLAAAALSANVVVDAANRFVAREGSGAS